MGCHTRFGFGAQKIRVELGQPLGPTRRASRSVRDVGWPLAIREWLVSRSELISLISCCCVRSTMLPITDSTSLLVGWMVPLKRSQAENV